MQVSAEWNTHTVTEKLILSRRMMVGGPLAYALGLSATQVFALDAPRSRSVESFGALGDGKTDDTEAINRALALGGAIVLRPQSTYLTTSPLRPISGSRFFSDGSAEILRRGTDSPSILLDGVSNVQLSNFKIIGDKQATATDSGHGIFIDWRRTTGGNVRIQNVAVRDVSGAGVQALASSKTRSHGLSVLSCNVESVGSHGILVQDYIDAVSIINCRVERCGLSVPDRPGITAARFGVGVLLANNICTGTAEAKGRSVHGISADRCKHVTVRGNRCIGWKGYGIEIGGVSEGLVLNNILYRNNYGITGSGESGEFINSNIDIRQNLILDSEGAGIYFFMSTDLPGVQHKNIRLLDNRISKVQGPNIGIGLFLNHIQEITLLRNRVESTTRSGVYLNDCLKIRICDLIVDAANTSNQSDQAGLVARWRVEQPDTPSLHNIVFLNVMGRNQLIQVP